MPQTFNDVTHQGDALPSSERRHLAALIERLRFPTREDADEMRDLLQRLSTTPMRFAPPVEDLQSRVRAAIFWRDCRGVRLVASTGGHRIDPHPRVDKDFEGLDEISRFHAISKDFWEATLPLVDDPFVMQIWRKLGSDLDADGILHGSLKLDAVLAIISCLDFALASHFDGIVLRKGRRFAEFFRLYFDGNLIVGYDRERHEALVIVAPR